MTGILAGPYVLGLIPIEAKDKLNFINETALAFIAFAAGAELYLRELRSRLKAIKIHSIVQSVVGLLIGIILVYLIVDFIPIGSSLNDKEKFVISLLTAVLFLAPSPASVIAIISELRAKGTFTRTVLGVTMAKDFFVVVLFAIALSVSKSITSSESFQVVDILFLISEIAISIGLAFLNGRILVLILKFGRLKNLKSILILTIGYLNYSFSNFFRGYSMEAINHEIYLEPLLICLIASFIVANFTPYRAEFIRILNDLSLLVYLAFFTLTGASMDIPVLEKIWGIALAFFFIRLLSIIISNSLSNFIIKEEWKLYQVGWMPYVAQAGVALGLVTVISNQFPGWGQELATICIAVIIINQLIGPPIFKWAIYQVGEDRSRAQTPEFDGVRDATIIGYEGLSVALAQQLQSQGWEVQLVTKKDKGTIEEPENVKVRYMKEFTYENLKKIDADKSEAIICLLSDEENLQICEVAYRKFGTRDLIVRLNQRYNSKKFLELKAKVVDPSTAMVSLLDQFVRSPQAASLLLGMEKGQDTRDIELLNPDLHGITLRDLRLPADVIILSVVRGGQTIITHGYTRLRIKDVITAVGSFHSLNEVQLKFDR